MRCGRVKVGDEVRARQGRRRGAGASRSATRCGRVKVGDEVIANPGMSCGRCEFCADGEESLCTSFGIMGLSRPGSFAEKVALPAECLAAKPAHLTDEEAAALPLAHLTVWRMLMSRARVQSGETVLIHGIGGGVALAALQISLLAGAQTIVTSSSADKLIRAAALGAHHTLNYAETEDLAKEVLVLTAGRGVDVAFDTVGAGTLPVNIQALRKGGRMVLCGVTGGSQGELDLQQVYWKQLSILGSTMGSQGEFAAMVEAVSRHQVKPVMDCALPMERAREAFARMEKGDQFGKIVLRIR